MIRFRLLRRGQVSEKDTTRIYVRLTLNGVRAKSDFTTGLSCKVGNFDTKAQRVVGKHADPINERLAAITSDIRSIMNRLHDSGRSYSVETIKEIYLGRGAINMNLAGLIDAYLAVVARQAEKNLRAESTAQRYRGYADNLRDFLSERRYLSLLPDEVTLWIGNQYFEWLLTRPFKHNYALKNLGMLKAVLAHAVGIGLIPQSRLSALRISREKVVPPKYLTQEDLLVLKATPMSEALNRVRNLFLLQCLTGLAYVDLKSVEFRHLVERKERSWLVKPRQKTNAESLIPLSPMAVQLIEQLGGFPLPVPSLKTMNELLKIIGERCNFTQKLTTHLGRKTFADTKLNVECLSPSAVSAMLGHDSPASLSQYARPRIEKLEKEIFG